MGRLSLDNGRLRGSRRRLVDEESELRPGTKRGKERVRAEAAWQALAQEASLPLHIFRLAGIYGPSRGPFEKVRDGTARRIIKQGQVFSRIHVADIAAALHLSMQHPQSGAIYNLCDDDPPRRKMFSLTRQSFWASRCRRRKIGTLPR